MFETFVSSLSGVFNRRFMVGYWAPAFFAGSIALSIFLIDFGAQRALDTWKELDGVEQVILEASSLITVTVVGYALQAMAAPMVRYYEGYSFRGLGNWIGNWAKFDQGRHRPARPVGGYFDYPRHDEFLERTGLGNALRAAGEYAYEMYGLDGTIWWPRLAPLLPETFRDQADDSIVPMMFLLNMATILTLEGILGGLWFLFTGKTALFVVFFGLGPLLGYGAYRMAIVSAQNYGMWIRAGFDLYRNRVLEAMRVSLPKDLQEELLTWRTLNGWAANYTPPWMVMSKPPEVFDKSGVKNPDMFPFRYASVETSGSGDGASVEASGSGGATTG